MAPLLAPPTTETLAKAASEEIAKKFEVKIGENHTADLFVLHDRTNVFLESSEEPVAVLRFGGPYSGALWLEGNLIGEFIREPAGSFVLIEIEDGFKRPPPIEDTDPIVYLLDRLIAEGHHSIQ